MMFVICLTARAAPPHPPAPLAPPGPANPSVLPAEAATPLSAYADGSDSRLALLVTDSDSRWLPVAHGLKTIGVPFQVVLEAAAAVRHPVLMVVGELRANQLGALRTYVETGGTLIVASDYPERFQALLGVDAGQTSPRMRLDFVPAGGDLLGLRAPEELHLRFGVNPERSLSGTGWTHLAADTEALAAYEDGQTALVRHRVGRGQTFVFGFNLGTILYRGQSCRDEWFGRADSNIYEPCADVFLRLLARIYGDGNPAAVTLGTVPEGKPLAMILTHDVDYVRSVGFSRDFAEFEHSAGIEATYFIQTKYINDWLDSAFFDSACAGILRQLASLGHELASHSVSHSPVFAKFELGSGSERFPEYHPSVHNHELTYGGSIMGELRVSRYLLQSLLPEQPVLSFRPGYLASPAVLPQALQATGYRFDSSMTAPNCLSHLPYQQNRDRRASQELDLYEFPITVSDSMGGVFTDFLPAANTMAENLQRYGGCCVLLIHPNNIEDKLQFEKSFVQTWRNRAWFGTLGGFGRWWAARDHAGVDVESGPGEARIRLRLAEPIAGLPLRVPRDWTQPRASQGTVTGHGPGELLVSAPAGLVTITLAR